MDEYREDITSMEDAKSSVTQPVSLTGVWTANDGAHYYIRQIGNQVWWAGLNSAGEGTVFTHVFLGCYNPDTNIITGDFADVPWGTLLFEGPLELLVVSNTHFIKLSGSFGANNWTFLKSHGV